MFSLYAEESYWIGVKRSDGVWLKTDGRNLLDHELSFEDSINEGDCLIASIENDFKSKIVPCTEEFKVSHITLNKALLNF